MTDSEFLAWLDAERPRVVLAEVQCYVGNPPVETTATVECAYVSGLTFARPTTIPILAVHTVKFNGSTVTATVASDLSTVALAAWPVTVTADGGRAFAATLSTTTSAGSYTVTVGYAGATAINVHSVTLDGYAMTYSAIGGVITLLATTASVRIFLSWVNDDLSPGSAEATVTVLSGWDYLWSGGPTSDFFDLSVSRVTVGGVDWLWDPIVGSTSAITIKPPAGRTVQASTTVHAPFAGAACAFIAGLSWSVSVSGVESVAAVYVNGTSIDYTASGATVTLAAAPGTVTAEVVTQTWEGILGHVETRYLSDGAYISHGTDTPAHTAYEDVILEVPGLRLGIDTTLMLGELLLANDGSLDGWVADAWGGRPIQLLIGEPSWPRAQFRPILTGIVDDLASAEKSRLTLAIRDRKELLNREYPLGYWDALAWFPDAGQPKVEVWGEAYNVGVTLVHAPDRQYAVQERCQALTAVRDKGLPAAYTGDATHASIWLSASPGGTVTADFKGRLYNQDGSWVYADRPAGIAYRLALQAGVGLAASDFDTTAITALDAVMGPAGIVLNSRVNCLAVIDEVLATAGCYWYADETGRFVIWRLEPPTGTTAALEIGPDDILAGTLRLTKLEPPIAVLRMGSKKNWTVQDKSSVYGGVSLPDRERYASEWLGGVVSATNADVSVRNRNAAKPDLIPTLWVDAQPECSRRAGMYAQPRQTWQAQVAIKAARLRLGQEIKVTHPDYGFSDGRHARVIGLEPKLREGYCTVEFWL